MKRNQNAVQIRIPQHTVIAMFVATLGMLQPIASLAQTQPNQAAPESSAAEEIVVSASRITRAGFTAPTPTTELGAQDFQNKASTTLSDVLYDLPAVRSGGNSNILTTNGGNYINLRNLNANNSPRTLVMVDGRRFVPTGTFGQVDSNVVPVGLIQTVQVVTGGASAAWGSDAVAGVANIILKKKMEGFEGNVQSGASQRGDDKTYSGALSWGTAFGQDRGQFIIGGEYSRLFDTTFQRDRDWANKRSGYVPQTIDGIAYTRVVKNGLSRSVLPMAG